MARGVQFHYYCDCFICFRQFRSERVRNIHMSDQHGVILLKGDSSYPSNGKVERKHKSKHGHKEGADKSDSSAAQSDGEEHCR